MTQAKRTLYHPDGRMIRMCDPDQVNFRRSLTGDPPIVFVLDGCDACNGEGWVECETCAGKGVVGCGGTQLTLDGGEEEDEGACRDCEDGDRDCEECDGYGEVWIEENEPEATWKAREARLAR